MTWRKILGWVELTVGTQGAALVIKIALDRIEPGLPYPYLAAAGIGVFSALCIVSGIARLRGPE